MYGCEVMWGNAKAAEVQRLVESALGGDCPCKSGRRCPVLPDDVELPLRQMAS